MPRFKGLDLLRVQRCSSSKRMETRMTHDLARLSTDPASSSWPIDCAELDEVANICPMSLAAGDGGASEPTEWRPKRAAVADRTSEGIIFIDSGVSDVSAIVKAASLDGEIVMLDPGADGLVQIASHLAGRSVRVVLS